MVFNIEMSYGSDEWNVGAVLTSYVHPTAEQFISQLHCCHSSFFDTVPVQTLWMIAAVLAWS